MMTLVENREIKFSEFLGTHPHLYDGVDLTSAEIDYLNNEFWDYSVKERTFESHYIQMIRKHIAQYKNAKSIEFTREIFNLVTNQSIRKYASTVTDNFSSNRIGNSGSTTTNNLTTETEVDSRNANKELPMKSQGSTFDNIVKWNSGASGISENKQDNTTRNTGTVGIAANDSQSLTNLNNHMNSTEDKNEARNGQAVDLIRKIWSYIIEPKAMEWFCSKLEICFILTL